MNHKQKIGYTILGAFIMLIGMLIDNRTSPPVTAQTDGVITCQKLTFVDEAGEPLFILQAKTEGVSDHQLSIRNKVGQETVRLTSIIFDRLGRALNSVYLFNDEGKVVVALTSGGYLGPSVEIYDDDSQGSILLLSGGATIPGARVEVRNKQGKGCASMGVNEYGGRINVFNKQGENRAAMSVNEYGNGAVSTWDKNGYRQ